MPSRRPPISLDTRKTTSGWPELWFRHKPLKHVAFKTQGGGALRYPKQASNQDFTRLLSDEILLQILSRIPPPVRDHCSLVCKRWLRIVGRLRSSLTLLDWSFLDKPNCRLLCRFPDLVDVDLLPASIIPPAIPSGIILSRGSISVPLASKFDASPSIELLPGSRFISLEAMDRGLEILSRGFPSLRKLSLAAVSSEVGLMKVAEECAMLQELILHRCSDAILRPISAFKNLQILKLIGAMQGINEESGVSDVGLTIVAHGCKRLVKLDLSGCEGSYDGISAIGRCCVMLEELTLRDHRMEDGWTAALSFCENLKTLRFHGCRRIDPDPGPFEYLGSCAAIEGLHLQRCSLRDKRSLQALFILCAGVKELGFQDCWGLDDDIFYAATVCREVKVLTLDGCSLLSTRGLESAITSWKDIQKLRIVACNKIKDGDVTPALADIFSLLKELKWRPNSRSLLEASTAGTGMGNKGGRFFK